MQRNIFIVYILSFLESAYFWLGSWVFFYLQFTNYAGIGLAETGLIVAMVLGEIPAGAFADLYGRKKSLIVAFFLLALGGFIMTFTPNYALLVAGIIISGFGVAFFSGALEALAYDSLKEHKREHTYNKVIANINSVSLVSLALCGAVGGFLHSIDPKIPFFLSALFWAFGCVVAFFLHEPKIAREKFSLALFLKQTRSGADQLFRTKVIKHIAFVLLGIGAIIVVMDEMLNDFLSVEFGYNAAELGLLWAGIALISAFISRWLSHSKYYKASIGTIYFIGLTLALSLILSPVAGMIIGGLLLLVRFTLQTIFENQASELINHHSESAYRATTLSTFNLIRSLPYVFTAYFLGSMADTYSAIILAFSLGIFLFMYLGITAVLRKRKRL